MLNSISGRAELITTLQTNIVTIKFVKANGDLRTMRCTLQDSYLPPVVSPNPHPWLEESLPVWDIDEAGWRSFRFDSVEDAEYTNERTHRHFKLALWSEVSERTMY